MLRNVLTFLMGSSTSETQEMFDKCPSLLTLGGLRPNLLTVVTCSLIFSSLAFLPSPSLFPVPSLPVLSGLTSPSLNLFQFCGGGGKPNKDSRK